MDESTEPLFVARTEEEYEAKFAATREAGRLSVAKANGFESVEGLESALQEMKASPAGAELAEARQREAESKAELYQLKADVQAATVELEAQRQVIALGGTPRAVADILTLREKTSDFLQDGEPKVDGIRTSIEEVLREHPQLRGGQVRGQSSAAASTGSLVDGIKARLKEKFRR